MKPEQKEAVENILFAEDPTYPGREEDRLVIVADRHRSVRPATLGPERAGGDFQILSGSERPSFPGPFTSLSAA